MIFAKQTKREITRRGIQISLGYLWLLDGLLQLQRQMFSHSFATQVIAPAGNGQPIVVYGPINFEIHMLLLHPAVFDAMFAIIQLTLAVLILNKRTVRIGLISSIIWGLAVWWMGEGFGGLLNGQTSLLFGAPGAAILYVLIALAVLPHQTTQTNRRARKPAYWLPVCWTVLWVGGAIYQLLPGQNTASDIASSIAANAGGNTPGWLNELDRHTASFILGKGFLFVLTLVLVQAAIGLFVLFSVKMRKVAIGGGIVLSLAFWFVGQSLGTYFSGLATDPNTAPLFILLGIAILGAQRFNYHKLFRDASKFLNRIGDMYEAPPIAE